MNIRQLQYFIDLTDTLNFTHTAQNFYISQTAITKQIQNLEEELKLKLFERNKKTVTLTSEGQVFLPYANQIISDYYQAFQAISQYKRGEKGIVRIGFIKSCDETLLLNLFETIKKQFPSLTLEYKAYRKKELIDLFLNHELDAVILFEVEQLKQQQSLFLKQFQLKKYYHKDSSLNDLSLLYDVRDIKQMNEDSELEQTLLKLCLKEGYAILHEFIDHSYYMQYLQSETMNETSSLYMYYHSISTNKPLENVIDCIKKETEFSQFLSHFL